MGTQVFTEVKNPVLVESDEVAINASAAVEDERQDAEAPRLEE
jgi:hypothetical protein